MIGVLFRLSKNSQISKFALREWNYASKRAEEDRSKHIVIVNIDGCKMVPEFEFMYGLTDTILWTDVAQHDKLLRDLKNWLGTEADTLKEAKEVKVPKKPKMHLPKITRKGWIIIASIVIVAVIIVCGALLYNAEAPRTEYAAPLDTDSIEVVEDYNHGGIRTVYENQGR